MRSHWKSSHHASLLCLRQSQKPRLRPTELKTRPFGSYLAHRTVLAPAHCQQIDGGLADHWWRALALVLQRQEEALHGHKEFPLRDKSAGQGEP